MIGNKEISPEVRIGKEIQTKLITHKGMYVQESLDEIGFKVPSYKMHRRQIMNNRRFISKPGEVL